MLESFINKMDKLEQEILESYFNKNRVPDVLYQYTDENGLKGILQSKVFWATDSEYLNDESEIEYGNALISNVLVRHQANVSPLLSEIYDDVIGIRYGSPSIRRSWDDDLYIVSFSQLGDDLNQWGRYASDGEGYAIGINPHELYRKIKGPEAISYTDEGLSFIKVSYNEAEQTGLVFDLIKIADTIIEEEFQFHTGREKELFPGIAAKKMSSILYKFAMFYKHNGFESENEWRVVKNRWGSNVMRGINNFSQRGVKHRARGSLKIPYLELDFTARYDRQLIPIEEIRLGPLLRNTDAQQQLERYLHTLGYSKRMPILAVSSIPYRKL
ncbi:MAG: DUF2971 domain-containing protein [Anaerolineae bacterium]|nr:DUF2971 domain-containing protein [Anaerolineae bacterium]